MQKLGPGFEKERLRDLPRAVSYRSLLELNLSVGVAASYLHTEQLEGKIRNANGNEPKCGWPSLDLGSLGTLWPFESYVHDDVVNEAFCRWYRCEQFPKLWYVAMSIDSQCCSSFTLICSEVFSSFGFTPVGSMSYFSTSFCMGDMRVPMGVAVRVTSSALRHHKNQQTDVFARQQLIAANLPILALMAISCCHVDNDGNLVYEPFSEAFVFGIAILDQEIMIELLFPYFDRDSENWKIYCCPCHSIVFGDLTLARMRPHYKYLQLLNYMSAIQIHHQTLASKLVGHTWDKDVSAVFSQPFSIN